MIGLIIPLAVVVLTLIVVSLLPVLLFAPLYILSSAISHNSGDFILALSGFLSLSYFLMRE